MIFLLASILTSSSLLVFFKLFGRYQVRAPQAIAINYLTAAMIGLFFTDQIDLHIASDSSWIITAGILGGFFALIFNISRISTQQAGLAVTSLAMKLAVVFPVIFGVLIYHEKLTMLQCVGLGLGVLSIILINIPSKNTNQTSTNASVWFLPLLVWFGSGFCDSSVQFANKSFAQACHNGSFGFLTFWSAAFCSMTYLIWHRQRFRIQEVIGGIALGIPNYFSIYFLLKCLDIMQNKFLWASSKIFMVNNLSIIICSIIIGFIFFGERFHIWRICGIILAIGSLILLNLPS